MAAHVAMSTIAGCVMRPAAPCTAAAAAVGIMHCVVLALYNGFAAAVVGVCC